jgi:hypothetical protein
MRSLVVSMLAPLAASILGCVDATPSNFTVPDAGSGGAKPDVDYGDLPPDAIADPKELCVACLAAPEDPGPGCATAYDACVVNAQCLMIVNCYLDTGCAMKASMGEATLCAVPCFQAAGVTGFGDPVIAIASPVGACAYAACQPACGRTP